MKAQIVEERTAKGRCQYYFYIVTQDHNTLGRKQVRVFDGKNGCITCAVIHTISAIARCRFHWSTVFEVFD